MVIRSGWLVRLAMAAVVAVAPVAPNAATTPPTQPLDLFDLGAPSFTTFTTRDGLPDPVAVTLATDRQGMVWVGTPHGLAWHDGKRWHPLDDPALHGYIS